MPTVLNPANSFPVAVFWMFIGKMFADNKKRIFNKVPTAIGVLSSSICLWIEWKVSVNNGSSTYENNDCFISLIPLSICVFILIKDADIGVKNAKGLRAMSIIIYSLHCSVTGATRYLLNNYFGMNNGVVLFGVVFVICHLAAFMILWLESKKSFSILKYSH